MEDSQIGPKQSPIAHLITLTAALGVAISMTVAANTGPRTGFL
jgi:hypothetical protein